MKLPIIISIATILTTTACVAPPANPMEAHLRRAAGGELIAKQCAAYAGGYSAIKDLKANANKHIVTARKMGATDADLTKARTDVASAFNTMSAFTSRQEACNSLIGELAWVD